MTPRRSRCRAAWNGRPTSSSRRNGPGRSGAELVASDERDVIVSTGAPRRRTYFIGALPTALTYDGSDDLLNPTRGFRLGGRVLARTVAGGQGVRLCARPARRQRLSAGQQGAGAGRARAASARSLGAPRDAIAPSRRFYAGGGGSVRGYGYQDIGPRDPNNDPIGGRSLTEFSIEARVKAFGNFGIVPFFDAGNIYTSPLPKFTQPALRRRHRRALLFELRPDPPRCRHADQPAKGRSAASPSMSRWGRRFERGRSPVEAGRARAGATPLAAPAGLALLAIAALVAAAVAMLDTGIGHRFVADRIAALRPANGLRYIDRADRGIALRQGGADRCAGLAIRTGWSFAAPRAALDWTPFAWLDNRLDIRSLHIPQRDARASCRSLTPTGRTGPILPGFDIRIGALRRRSADRRARRSPASSRTGGLHGKADIRSGRALVDLDATVAGSDTPRAQARRRARSRPVRCRRACARRGERRARQAYRASPGPIALDVAGDGRWSAWRGTAIGERRADARRSISRSPIASGRYALSGTLAPARDHPRQAAAADEPARAGQRATRRSPTAGSTAALSLRSAALAGRCHRRARSRRQRLSQPADQGARCCGPRRCSPT